MVLVFTTPYRHGRRGESPPWGPGSPIRPRIGTDWTRYGHRPAFPLPGGRWGRMMNPLEASMGTGRGLAGPLWIACGWVVDKSTHLPKPTSTTLSALSNPSEPARPHQARAGPQRIFRILPATLDNRQRIADTMGVSHSHQARQGPSRQACSKETQPQ